MDDRIENYNWHGFHPWGNYGDGKWRVGPPDNCQGNVISPTDSLAVAHVRLEEWICSHIQEGMCLDCYAARLKGEQCKCGMPKAYE